MNDDCQRDLYDRVLWALESTAIGHHPIAARAVTSRIRHLNFTGGRDEAIALAAGALGEFTPLSEEAAELAATLIHRLALDEPVASSAAA